MSRFFPILLWVITLFCSILPAYAIDSVRVPAETQAIDLTQAIEHFDARGDRLQVSTAPGPDGIIRRIEVSARQSGTNPSWIVFALSNDTSEQLERLIVVPHFRLVNSGILWPNLGSSHISAITSSQGLTPEREESGDADVFRLILDPGATVTYIAELRTPNLPQIYLWDPDSYKEKKASLTLYHGIVIGVSGLLALFLSILFIVKRGMIFPSAAALAWSVLAYVCVDFGFWDKILNLSNGTDPIWRAITETTLSASLLLFLFSYLNLSRWHLRASWWAAGSLVFLSSLILLAAYQPSSAVAIARVSLATIAVVGGALILSLALHRYDRAIMLVPTWFMLLLWVLAAGCTAVGILTNDLIAPALSGGLVLIVLLIGFTVMQNAFSNTMLIPGSVSDTQRRMFAFMGSGDSIFDWDTQQDDVYVSPNVEHALGFKRGRLEGSASSWLDLLHPYDRENYSLCLDTVFERRCGRVLIDFRLRAADDHYLWFRLKAKPLVGEEGEVLRVVGTLTEITEEKVAQERLLDNSLLDTLTNLPNRYLCGDRLTNGLALAQQRTSDLKPTFIALDIDQFRHINQKYGQSTGDIVLLTVVRRLTRLLKPHDTLARLQGDLFGIILLSTHPSEEVAPLVQKMRQALNTPIVNGLQEISFTTSMGMVLYDAQRHQEAQDMIHEAEITVGYAKRLGGNCIEIFRSGMRMQHPDPMSLQNDLRQGIEKDEIRVCFQPIVRLEDQTIAGFHALPHWIHPRLGRLPPMDFFRIAQKAGYDLDVSLIIIEKTVTELAHWQRALDVDPPIFVAVDVISSHLLRHDVLRDVKAILTKSDVIPGTFKLQISEKCIKDNFEAAIRLLEDAHSAGIGVILSDFGSYFSLSDYLKRFPFDLIKIPKNITKTSYQEKTSLLYERTLPLLAKQLKTPIMIDGLESEKEALALAQLGYEYGQGSRFSAPLSALDARRLIGAEEGS